MLFNPKYGVFGFYLPLNALAMIAIPLLQLCAVIMLPIMIAFGKPPFAPSVASLFGWLGLGFALFATFFSIALNHAWRDLRFLYAVLFWVPYSLMMDLVTLRAIILEFSGKQAQWNKLDRTGVISRKSFQ